MIYLMNDIIDSIFPKSDNLIIKRIRVPLDEGIMIFKNRGYHSCLGNEDVQMIRAFKAKTGFHLLTGESLNKPVETEDLIMILHTNLPSLYMRTEYTRKELGNAEFWFTLYEFADNNYSAQDIEAE